MSILHVSCTPERTSVRYSNLYRKIIKTETNREAQIYRIKVIKGTGTEAVEMPKKVQHILVPPCRVVIYITKKINHRPNATQTTKNK